MYVAVYRASVGRTQLKQDTEMDVPSGSLLLTLSVYMHGSSEGKKSLEKNMES